MSKPLEAFSLAASGDFLFLHRLRRRRPVRSSAVAVTAWTLALLVQVFWIGALTYRREVLKPVLSARSSGNAIRFRLIEKNDDSVIPPVRTVGVRGESDHSVSGLASRPHFVKHHKIDVRPSVTIKSKANHFSRYVPSKTLMGIASGSLVDGKGLVRKISSDATLSRTAHHVAAGVPKYIQRTPQGNSDVMRRKFIHQDYQPTVFDKYWIPQDRSLLGSALQDLVDATKFHKKINLGHGIHLDCEGSIMGIGWVFGCSGDPPPGPSAKSGDARLSMAPAKPLVPDVHAKRAASEPGNMRAHSSFDAVRCETALIAGANFVRGCRHGAKESTSASSWSHPSSS